MIKRDQKQLISQRHHVVTVCIISLLSFALTFFGLDYIIFKQFSRDVGDTKSKERQMIRVEITSEEKLMHEPNFDSLHEWAQYLHFLVYDQGVIPQEEDAINFIDEDKGVAVVYDGYPYSPPDLSYWDSNSSNWKRDTRFPSVEERIKYYMGIWYDAKPNHELFGGNFTIKNVDCKDIFVPKGSRSTQIFCLSNEDPNSTSPKLLYDYFQRFANDKTVNMGNTPYYVRDSIDIAILHANSETPVFIHFGDGSSRLSHALDFSFPVFGKVRDMEAEKDKVSHARFKTKAKCSKCGPKHSNIIWPLNRGRHFKQAALVPLFDTPWEEKKSKLMWRGRIEKESTVTNALPFEINAWKQRQYIVEHYFNSTLIDARFTGRSRDYIPDKFMDKKKEVEDLLKFKYLLSLEGNDVSSGLKWMLFSNSVVFLPPVTVASWAMETLLQPFVHFIPIHANLSNLEEMVMWAEEHPIVAKQIAEKSTLYIYDLLFHPDAYKDEELILEGIMKRYEEKFGV